MAVKLREFKSARHIYDWKRWTDGSVWQARHGEDFKCSVSGFRASLYSHAARFNKIVQVAMKGEVVEFQFVKTRKKRT